MVRNLKNSLSRIADPAFFSPYLASRETLAGLLEAADKNNRVLMLCRRDAKPRSGLSFRAVAALPVDSSGRRIFRETDYGLEFPVFAEGTAGMSPEESARALWPAARGAPRLLGKFGPCPENGEAFTTVFLIPTGPTFASGEFVPVERSGIKSMLERGYEFAPFARKLILAGVL